MRIVSATDTGLVRSSNQDSMASGTFPDGTAWACVCDGMGGANGGDFASSKAVEVIEDKLREGYEAGMSGNSLRALIDRAVQAGTYARLRLTAPYTNISKADIARKGKQLGVDYSKTWSCYKGGKVHCGRCATCIERKEALRLAGIEDTTVYENIGHQTTDNGHRTTVN